MSLSVVVPLSAADDSPRSTLERLLLQEQAPDQVLLALEQGSCHEKDLDILKQEFGSRLAGFRVVQVEADAGPVAVWNAGVGGCSSDWVSFVTPQVRVRPNFTRALRDSAERSKTAHVLRAGWTRERCGGGLAEQHTLLSVRTVTHPAEALYEQRFGPKASSAAAAVRRSAWTQMGGLPPEITLLGDWIGDWALWLTAGAVGDTVRSPEIVADISATPTRFSKPEELRQMFLIYRDILPRAARTAQLPNLGWIDAASRKRVRDVAISASNELQPNQHRERQAVSDALENWAEAVDQRPLLARFRNGERIRNFGFGKKLKPALRRVVAAVR